MGRYTGKVVTGSNPFIGSMESNTVDPNADDNPLFDTQTEDGSADRDHGNDFEVAGEDLVDGAKVSEGQIITEGEVLNKINEIDNIVKEGNTANNVVEALAAVSTEMRAILADSGKMTPGEFMVMRGVIASCESAMPSLRSVETAVPSMESYKITGLEYSHTNVSMESITEKLSSAMNNLKLNLQRLFKNGVGLANSMTPLFNKQIERAQRVRDQLNSAHRDDGQKTVTGKFIKNLSIGGRSPDANTTLKTARYLAEVSKQVLSFDSTTLASDHIKNALTFIDSGVDFTKLEKPSMWLLFVIWISKAMSVVAHPLADAVANAGAAAENEVNRRVFDKLRVSGDMAPELFNVYSTVAKVGTPSKSKNLESRKSLPLFGGTELVVSQYAKEINMTLGHDAVPSLEVVRDRNWGGAKNPEIQSLTSQQQTQTIDAAIEILSVGRDYFKNYAVRNGRCMEIYQRAYQMKVATRKESKANGFSSADKYILPVYNFYARLYWRGIFSDQAKFANYARTSAKALIDLVDASSTGAQGGAETPSTEAYADFL